MIGSFDVQLFLIFTKSNLSFAAVTVLSQQLGMHYTSYLSLCNKLIQNLAAKNNKYLSSHGSEGQESGNSLSIVVQTQVLLKATAKFLTKDSVISRLKRGGLTPKLAHLGPFTGLPHDTVASWLPLEEVMQQRFIENLRCKPQFVCVCVCFFNKLTSEVYFIHAISYL